MKKNIRLSLTVLITAVFSLSFTACLNSLPAEITDPPQQIEYIQPEEKPAIEVRVSFSAAGDNLIHNTLYNQARRRAQEADPPQERLYDFSYIYENIRPFLEQFDINWINQETLVNDELEPSTYPLFSTPGDLGRAAYEAGWRVFSLSNNHSYDFGTPGIAATRRFWASMPRYTMTAGLYERFENIPEITLHTVKGLNLAYLAYTESTNGMYVPNTAEARVIYTSQRKIMEDHVRRAAELADVVIVGVHWGNEYTHVPTKNQRALAEELASWGADVIIGTHPHVIQPVEWIETGDDGRKTLTAYSLGNFISAQREAPRLVGIFLTFELVLTLEQAGPKREVWIENVRTHPVVTHYGSGFSNVRNYLFRDYSEELAASHGVRHNEPEFSMKYIETLLRSHIDPQFLVLD
ncbi:CapA family protein [Breznakiella homolactica]|uniref:CapA family protein n=1 Tax=Breznakiella homolactica TaxID=2798577 RepID=UPI001CBA6B43|nr:CapA family protein [Breznakiella homolactica]